ncbi:hypothetical protein JW916_08835, partial [Candidatus Sumerlaeota bacterium]|nr:hypothetical protein [Candidatus Sumerlaeota bacterium]
MRERINPAKRPFPVTNGCDPAIEKRSGDEWVQPVILKGRFAPRFLAPTGFTPVERWFCSSCGGFFFLLPLL